MHPYDAPTPLYTTPATAFPIRTTTVAGWWNQFYYDHPGRKIRSQAARTGDKWKVYCMRCFESHILAVENENEVASQNGITLNMPQNRAGIESYLWSIKAEDHSSQIGRGWRRSAASTLLNHIANCPLQETEVRLAAYYSPSATKSTGHSPVRTRRVGRSLQMALAHSSLQTHWQAGGGPSSGFIPSVPSFPTIPSTPSESLVSTPPLTVQTSAVSLPSSTPSVSTSTPPISTPAVQVLGSNSSSSLHFTPDLSPLLLSGRSTPQPSPHISSSIMNFASSRSLTRSGSNSNIHLQSPSIPWTAERQQVFEYRLARITASAGLSLSWIENMEFIALIEELAPAAQIPSRKVLTNRIIPGLVKHIQAINKKSTTGGFVTLQADGWTAKNNRHFIAFMITLITKIYTVKVVDVTTRRKTAKIFLEILTAVYHEVEKDWNVVVVAITTDASGETRQARRDFVKKFPSVVVLDCYAHQINLIVGDYFKNGCAHIKHTENAKHLITWLRSKTLLLGLIQEEQVRQNKHPTTIIRPVLTRWTAHLRAYQRLVAIESLLCAVIATEMGRSEKDRLFIRGDKTAKDKAAQMVAIIRDPIFWDSMRQVIRHLEPLGAAINTVQAAFCCLDTVILTFGYLHYIYSDLQVESSEDMRACQTILQSLEARWAKADQEPFIAAIIVHPFYQLTPFSKSSGLHLASALGLLKRLYKRFFSADPSIEFAVDAVNYLRRTNNFANLQDSIDIEFTIASHEHRAPNPNAILQSFHLGGSPESSFLIFARRLFSITANSASCERLFSKFGNTLTKLRNRMGNSTLSNLSELALQVCDEHLWEKNRREWLTKRLRDQNPATTDATRPLAPVGSASSLPSSDPPLLSGFNDISQEDGLSTDTDNANETSPPSIIRDLIDSYQSQLIDDARDNNPVFPIQATPVSNSSLPSTSTINPSTSVPSTIPPPQPSSITRFPLIPISDLFNYENPTWLKLISDSAEHSEEAELSLYDLLNSGWSSNDDDDTDFGVDATIEQLLVS